MDYVVGSVAALLTGNVTPNRPKKFKKALTPIKHQASPNVTPKSEFVEDRSIFMSPTTQKKKAIVKKSPKRIFQNTDLDVTSEEAGDTSIKSPKAIKVKKHLKDELDGTIASTDEVPKSTESNNKVNDSPHKKKKSKDQIENNNMSNVNTPNKKKKNRNSVIDNEDLPTEDSKIKENDAEKENITANVDTQNTTPKKKKKKLKPVANLEVEQEPIESNEAAELNDESVKQKNKKKKKKELKNEVLSETLPAPDEVNIKSTKKKNKKKKQSQSETESYDNVEINPNAVTHKDTDSEHESDNEMESENEEINKKALDPGPAEESSDEEEQKPKAEKAPKKEETVTTEDEVNRTIFVGNVPFSGKCKKEIKKIFSQYGQIETVRIRTIPVKDARVTPKMAVIKNELHPDRSTVNVYVKFADATSVEKALKANNTMLKDHHLRVSRSDSTGAAHDPKCSIFVGNMPFAIEDEILRSKFEKCGEIESVRIIRDKKTNAGKGFGYVNFKSKDGVELALALTEEDLTIKNRIMRVKRCTQVAQRKVFKPNNNNRQNQRPVQSQSSYGGRRQDVSNQRNKYNRNDDKTDGAYRRVMNKRKHPDGSEGPPNKRQNLNQPHKEKKPRKEFVGMTGEKKKKHKFDKGLKKKKVLSEILTKK